MFTVIINVQLQIPSNFVVINIFPFNFYSVPYVWKEFSKLMSGLSKD